MICTVQFSPWSVLVYGLMCGFLSSGVLLVMSCVLEFISKDYFKNIPSLCMLLTTLQRDRRTDQKERVIDLPAVRLLLLEQEERSLEDHTKDFPDLACLTHYPDRSLLPDEPQRAVQGTPARLLWIMWSGCSCTVVPLSPSVRQRKRSTSAPAMDLVKKSTTDQALDPTPTPEARAVCHVLERELQIQTFAH